LDTKPTEKGAGQMSTAVHRVSLCGPLNNLNQSPKDSGLLLVAGSSNITARCCHWPQNKIRPFRRIFT